MSQFIIISSDDGRVKLLQKTGEFQKKLLTNVSIIVAVVNTTLEPRDKRENFTWVSLFLTFWHFKEGVVNQFTVRPSKELRDSSLDRNKVLDNKRVFLKVSIDSYRH